MSEQYETLKLSQITAGEEVGFSNHREKIDAVELKQLADSIEEDGLKYPLQIWKTEKDGKEVNILIGGHRRAKAIAMLIEEGRANGFEKGIPVRFVKAINLTKARYEALDDNIQHVGLTSYEIAQECATLKAAGESQKDIALHLHKSETWVSRKIKMFDNAGKELRKAWRNQDLTDDNVADLIQVPVEEQPPLVAALVVDRSTENGRTGKAKARKKGKKAAGVKFQKASVKELTGALVYAEDAPKELRYVRGIRDGICFALGTKNQGDFDGEWKKHFKEVEKELEDKMAAEKEKEKAAKGKN